MIFSVLPDHTTAEPVRSAISSSQRAAGCCLSSNSDIASCAAWQ